VLGVISVPLCICIFEIIEAPTPTLTKLFRVAPDEILTPCIKLQKEPISESCEIKQPRLIKLKSPIVMDHTN
jgi:hypothetical protein